MTITRYVFLRTQRNVCVRNTRVEQASWMPYKRGHQLDNTKIISIYGYLDQGAL